AHLPPTTTPASLRRTCSSCRSSQDNLSSDLFFNSLSALAAPRASHFLASAGCFRFFSVIARKRHCHAVPPLPSASTALFRRSRAASKRPALYRAAPRVVAALASSGSSARAFSASFTGRPASATPPGPRTQIQATASAAAPSAAPALSSRAAHTLR